MIASSIPTVCQNFFSYPKTFFSFFFEYLIRECACFDSWDLPFPRRSVRKNLCDVSSNRKDRLPISTMHWSRTQQQLKRVTSALVEGDVTNTTNTTTKAVPWEAVPRRPVRLDWLVTGQRHNIIILRLNSTMHP